MRPRVIAHRGASDEAPENTEAAVRLALQQGADAVECDVQLSRDGVPLVVHDPDLLRIGGGVRRVAEHDAEDLIGTPLRVEGRQGEPARLLSLREWLALIPAGVLPVVELKPQDDAARDRELARAAAELLRERPDAAVISFEDRIVDESHRLLPQHRVGPIRNRALDEAARRSTADRVHGCLVLKKTLLEAELVAALRRPGAELWSYALDEEADLRRARAVQAEGWISNRPAFAVAARDAAEPR